MTQTSAPATLQGVERLCQQLAPERTDITTWFDLLDVDDYRSYGGKV